MSTLIKRVVHDAAMAATLEPEAVRAEADEKPVVTRLVYRGLGDQVYRLAHPIGCWLDRRTAKLGGRLAWAKTGLCGCSACSRRRQWLNALVPDVRRWKGGWQVGWATLKDSLKRVFRRR